MTIEQAAANGIVAPPIEGESDPVILEIYGAIEEILRDVEPGADVYNGFQNILHDKLSALQEILDRNVNDIITIPETDILSEVKNFVMRLYATSPFIVSWVHLSLDTVTTDGKEHIRYVLGPNFFQTGKRSPYLILVYDLFQRPYYYLTPDRNWVKWDMANYN